MAKKNAPNNSKSFKCIFCNFICSKNSDWLRHLHTMKHKRLTETNGLTPVNEFICTICGQKYKHQSSLYKHKKKCSNNKNNDIETNNNKNDDIDTINNTIINSQLMMQIVQQNITLITQNQEFKELIIELSKDKAINNYNNTTNNNNQFNLNFFLNEKCKDALNMDEFVEQLNVTLEDLEETGRLGYAEGISRIFVNGLKNLDIYKRPIHCSDAKRETLYIKHGDIWEKDDDKKKLKNAVRKVAQKNIRCITQWQKVHPHYNDTDCKDNDKYLKIIINSMCGSSEEEIENNYNKIMRNVIKQSVINKSNV